MAMLTPQTQFIFEYHFY